MPHAHLTVYHLLEQLEAERGRREGRDRRPRWLSETINAVAELFEPVEGVARVGFSCWPGEEGWVADLYLGSEEQVGGPHDGLDRPTNFRFDLLALEGLFDEVAEFTFDASRVGDAWEPIRQTLDRETFATIRGKAAGNSLTIHIHALPPEAAGPGFRRFPDGRREIRE